MQLWRSRFTLFIRFAQLKYCSKLIVVPLSVFHRMADSIGDPQGRIILLFNMGRCGSTLLTKVMKRDKNETSCYSNISVSPYMLLSFTDRSVVFTRWRPYIPQSDTRARTHRVCVMHGILQVLLFY